MKMLKLFAILVFFGITSAQAGPAGIPSSSLIIECSGQMKATEVNKVSTFSHYINRAGIVTPPVGYAIFKLVPQNLTKGCAEIQSKLGIDLYQMSFTATQYFKTTDLNKIKAEAIRHLGETGNFTVKQHFTYNDENGYLPFFPLLHEEYLLVQIQSNYFSSSSQNIKIDSVKAYGINLNTDKKIELSNIIFGYISKNGLKKKLSEQLFYPLVNLYPKGESNFKIHLTKLLKVFKQVEYSQTNIEDFNFGLKILAAGINSMTHQFPEYYAFDLPKLVVEHPSLFNVTTLDSKSSFPNLSAQDLEVMVELLENQLEQAQVSEILKQEFKRPLQFMAGHLVLGGKLGELSSKFVKEKANLILKKYY
jgi:hypothetical protein